MSTVQIRKLDDTEFKNPWARAYIRVTLLLTYVKFLVCGYVASESCGMCGVFMDS